MYDPGTLTYIYRSDRSSIPIGGHTLECLEESSVWRATACLEDRGLLWVLTFPLDESLEKIVGDRNVSLFVFLCAEVPLRLATDSERLLLFVDVRELNVSGFLVSSPSFNATRMILMYLLSVVSSLSIWSEP